MKAFSNFVSMIDANELQDGVNEARVVIHNEDYNGAISTERFEWACYVCPKLTEEFIEGQGPNTGWNTSRLRYYAGKHVLCKPILNHYHGESSVTNHGYIYTAERFYHASSGIKMKIVNFSRRYCFPSCILKVVKIIPKANSISSGSANTNRVVAIPDLFHRDKYQFVNKNHFISNDEWQSEEFQDNLYDDYYDIDGNWYMRDAIESGMLSNIKYDYYNEEHFDTTQWDYNYGTIDTRGNEGYFTNDDYAYSESADRYFMTTDIANANSYYWCEHRDTYVHEDDLEDYDNFDESIIRSYSYRPDPEFTKPSRWSNSRFSPTTSSFNTGYVRHDNVRGSFIQERYLGIEIEVEPQKVNYDVCASMTQDRIGEHVYCKSDSSIAGYEIVAHPATYEAVKLIKYKELMSDLKKRGTTSYKSGSCGIHVHVNRRSMSTLQWMKAIMFVYICSKPVTKISQRTTSKLNQWSAIQPLEHYVRRVTDNEFNTTIQKLLNGAIGSSARYSAINTQGSNTYEFRLFRGTTKYESFMAYIEFVECLCSFVQQFGSPIFVQDYRLCIRHGHFQNYPHIWVLFCVYAKTKQYSFLLDFLKRKHLYINV